EEFVILLPRTTAQAAGLLAERIRRVLRERPVSLGNGQEVTVTTSIGVASVSPQPEDTDLKTLGESLLARADVALYQAKAAGRDPSVLGDCPPAGFRSLGQPCPDPAGARHAGDRNVARILRDPIRATSPPTVAGFLRVRGAAAHEVEEERHAECGGDGADGE